MGTSPSASLAACVHSKDLKEAFLRTTQVTVSYLYAVVALSHSVRSLPARLPRTLSLFLPNRRGRENREEPCFLKQCRVAMLAHSKQHGVVAG